MTAHAIKPIAFLTEAEARETARRDWSAKAVVILHSPHPLTHRMSKVAVITSSSRPTR